MQLAQSEPLCAFNNHYRCIWNVHSNFDYRCSHKDIGSACNKGIHIELLDIILLLSMDDGSLVIRERELIHNIFCSSFKTLIIKLFCFVNQRIYNEDLTSKCNLLSHEII